MVIECKMPNSCYEIGLFNNKNENKKKLIIAYEKTIRIIRPRVRIQNTELSGWVGLKTESIY